MRKLIAALLLIAAPVALSASGADGVWKTESDKHGAYLHVRMEPCNANKSMICGVISEAFTKDGKDPGYANLGKPIVKEMKPDGTNSYSGGTVWDPQSNKTYKSKISISGNSMTVKGCIGPVCSGQNWTRVK